MESGGIETDRPYADFQTSQWIPGKLADLDVFPLKVIVLRACTSRVQLLIQP